MIATLHELRQYLVDPNLRGFGRVLREGESDQTDNAYRLRYNGAGGRAYFDDFAEHPAIFVPIPNDPEGRKSSAAGAYQYTHTTWTQEVKPELDRLFGRSVDFSPEMQDAGLPVLLDRTKGALPLVLAGDLDAAMAVCRGRWTSLPGAAENKRVTRERAHAVYTRYGGTYGPATPGTTPKLPQDPAPSPAPTSNPPEAKPMGGLAAAGFVGQLLQSVIGAFAAPARQKVEQTAAKITDADSAGILANGIMGILQQVTGIADPIQATAAVTAPTPAGRAALALVEAQTVARLDELAGFLETIAKLDNAAREASDASFDRAARRADNPDGWRLRWSQSAFTHRMLGYASIAIAILIAAMTASLTFIPENASAAVLNLIGQLVVLEVTTIGAFVSTFRDQNGFSFGGTVDNNAAAIGRAEIEARRKP